MAHDNKVDSYRFGMPVTGVTEWDRYMTRPAAASTHRSTFDYFMGHGYDHDLISDGNPGGCCDDCICAENCLDIELVCEDYCQSMTPGPSVLTEIRYYGLRSTCTGTWDYKPSYAYSDLDMDDSGFFWTNYNKCLFTKEFDGPAILQDVYINKKTWSLFYVDKLDENGEEIVCGTGSSHYSTADGDRADLWAGFAIDIDWDYEDGDVFGAKKGYNVRSCNKPRQSYVGCNFMIGWQVGHPSAWGWLNSSGNVNMLYDGSQEPEKVYCDE